MATVGVQRVGVSGRVKSFYHQVRDEMKKVSWPTWEETKAHTYVVMYLLCILGVIVGAYDYIFKYVILLVLKLS